MMSKFLKTLSLMTCIIYIQKLVVDHSSKISSYDVMCQKIQSNWRSRTVQSWQTKDFSFVFLWAFKNFFLMGPQFFDCNHRWRIPNKCPSKQVTSSILGKAAEFCIPFSLKHWFPADSWSKMADRQESALENCRSKT